MIRVVGLDLSLTSTGIAFTDDTRPGCPITVSSCKPGDKLRGHERMDYILGTTGLICHGAALVVLEAPVTYTSRGAAIIDQAGLSWLVRHMLYGQRIPYALVPPPNLKKYATGAGGGKLAGKDQVLLAVERRFPSAGVSGNDEADAVVLAAMGADHLGEPVVVMPAEHRRGLEKILWPAVNLAFSRE